VCLTWLFVSSVLCGAAVSASSAVLGSSEVQALSEFFSLAVSLALFAFRLCSYSPLLLCQLFAFCVLWCLAFLLRNAVLCELSSFLIADCNFPFGLVDVISLAFMLNGLQLSLSIC
jgi:hypothetical protein